MCREHRSPLIDSTINNFLQTCTHPHDPNLFPLTQHRAAEIAEHYFAQIADLSSQQVTTIIGILSDSFEAHVNNRFFDKWNGCCHGFADYLLRGCLTTAGGITAAGVLVRFSGYVHHRITFCRAFQPTALQIEDMIWGGLLPYLKIGEEWNFSMVRLSPSLIDSRGYMTLWDFACGNRPVPKLDEETRTLASRILNFICQSNFTQIEIEFSHNREIENVHFDSWSVTSQTIGFLATRIRIPANQLLTFLQAAEFDVNRTYNPRRNTRLNWYRTWRVI